MEAKFNWKVQTQSMISFVEKANSFFVFFLLIGATFQLC